MNPKDTSYHTLTRWPGKFPPHAVPPLENIYMDTPVGPEEAKPHVPCQATPPSTLLESRLVGEKLYPITRYTVRRKLEDRGVPVSLAVLLASALTVGTATPGQIVYIAGPMRGYPYLNFPAFDNAESLFIRQGGWDVFNPANADRIAGDSKDALQPPRVYAERDCTALLHLTKAIAMLPGWEKSTGAAAEFMLARWLQLPILDACSGLPLSRDSVDWTALQASVSTYLPKGTP